MEMELMEQEDGKVTSEEAAEILETTPLVVKTLGSAGCLGPSDYQPTAKSAAAAARALGVSERTISTWKGEGCPCGPGIGYPIASMRRWRREKDPTDIRYLTGNPRLGLRHATGDALRGLLRVLRDDLRLGVNAAAEDFANVMYPDADEETRETIRFAFLCAADAHLSQFLLDDEEIERYVEDLWPIV